jgi:tRNA(Arg) A34 adenosine deaminase TadA
MVTALNTPHSNTGATPFPAHDHHRIPSRSDLARWMRLALDQAVIALSEGDAPIGCVVVDARGTVLGEGCNTMHSSGSVIAHAEINAFAACGALQRAGDGLTLISTLEPCVMCTGAAMQSGVSHIVFALSAPADAGTTRVSPPESPGSSQPTITGGILSDASRLLFERWLQMHKNDPSRDEQRMFIEQLLELNAEADGG